MKAEYGITRKASSQQGLSKSSQNYEEESGNKYILKNHKPLTAIIPINRFQEENQQKKEQDAKVMAIRKPEQQEYEEKSKWLFQALLYSQQQSFPENSNQSNIQNL